MGKNNVQNTWKKYFEYQYIVVADNHVEVGICSLDDAKRDLELCYERAIKDLNRNETIKKFKMVRQQVRMKL